MALKFKPLNINTEPWKPTETIEITENGIYDVTNCINANVNVSGDEEETIPSIKDLISFKGSCQYLFYGLGSKVDGTAHTHVESKDLSDLINYNDTENITNFYGMFYYSTLKNIPIMNMEDANNLNYMFYDSKIEEIDFNRLNFSKATNLGDMFNKCIGNSLQTSLDIEVSDECKSAYQMFFRSDIKNLFKFKLTGKNIYNFNSMLSTYNTGPYIEELEINTSVKDDNLNLSGMSNNKYLKKITINLTNVDEHEYRSVNLNTVFYGSINLIEVNLNLNKYYIINGSTSSAFNNCKSLEILNIKNIKSSLQIGSGTTYGHLLTLDSLLNTIQECINAGSALTLTIGTANIEKLANVYVRLTNEAEEDESNPKLPMEVCESTDEGAMTITEYMTLKNWSIA